MVLVKKMVLVAASIGVGAIGLGYCLFPHWMVSLYGLQVDSVNEWNMLRGAYGGLFIAFSLLFAMGAYANRLRQTALTALFVFMAGFAVGRGYSVWMDGLPSVFILVLLAAEIVSALVASYLLL